LQLNKDEHMLEHKETETERVKPRILVDDLAYIQPLGGLQAVLPS
jgi:hypothetical protein